ncbi:Flap endonuclease GEN 1 [Lecanosticta acicola]|uniref:Flap endonuclease GEN 1 n=1 Tax=Lecanosticta acicola TaxID=111012 RepID=A0AAI8W223_9PEZI|nr:Flap endonuclease GEN 1 [Lecanosticta acicola]
MGIHGIFKEIGPGQRISLLKLSSDHLVAHNRPFRLAIDISIWLFQIQAGKGGSNPALRTFYYRLLRLLSLNIQPLFVFDGPNKPLFKRNKKVGGPGVRVASVPEFLAKQLLKHFGFPWHVAPGEAEAECALLQKEGLVDAVFSEDVDTLMFGSLVTLKNWSAEGSSKVPTHVNVYRAAQTKEKSGMDKEGMVLVALMSGGDYIPEGIPGCGPKLACDAARAGFGKELITLASKKDTAGLKEWRERFQHQIRTNEAKFFSRKNSKLVIPEDFPNQEVFGYYTHPCVSTPERVQKLKDSLKWDSAIDFAGLRDFAGDAFDWRNLGGAKKFIRNLAPAMLVRELRLRGDEDLQLDPEAQEAREKELVTAIHGKRNHHTSDGELEYRICFVPHNLVPIDLSIEDEDDDFIPAGGLESDVESEFATIASTTADGAVDLTAPASPSKRKRTVKPYEPDQPEKIWLVHSFLKLGSPLLVEDHEASLRDPKALLKARRQAKAATASSSNIHAKKPTKRATKKQIDMPQHALMQHFTVVKSSQEKPSTQEQREPLKTLRAGANVRAKASRPRSLDADEVVAEVSRFVFPQTKALSSGLLPQGEIVEVEDDDETPKPRKQAPEPAKTRDRPFLAFAAKNIQKRAEPHRTPQRRKRRSPDVASPALSQRTIDSYYSPSPGKALHQQSEIIDLISSSPVKPDPPRAGTPTPTNPRMQSVREVDLVVGASLDYSPGKLPSSVTKRRKKASLKRHQTAPPQGVEDDLDFSLPTPTSRPSTPDVTSVDPMEAMDLASPPFDNFAEARGFLKEAASLSMPGKARLKAPVTLPMVPPPAPAIKISKPKSTARSSKATSRPDSSSTQASAARRSPRQHFQVTKKRIQLRESLEGSWKEVDDETETLDLSGDGSGFTQSKGRAKLEGRRVSGIEILDLTGA